MEKYLTSNLLKNPKIIDLLEKRDFESLYLQLARYDRSKFTEECLLAGVDPLDYMTLVPSYYLEGKLDDLSTLTLPSHIKLIDAGALQFAELSDIYYEGTIEEFERVVKQPYWMPLGVSSVSCTDGEWHEKVLNTTINVITNIGPLPPTSSTSVGTVLIDASSNQLYVNAGSTWMVIDSTASFSDLRSVGINKNICS